MTDIAEIFKPPPIPNSTPEYTSNSSSDMMGKEDFLTLLVEQLKNQDPMNPDDPSEFTSQLAEFSSLEQLQNLNESMESLAETQKQSDKFATMALIGKDITYTGGNFTFDGEPVSIGYQLDGQASSVTMSIQNENGSTVAVLHPTELNKGNHFIEWNGLNQEGDTFPEGKYKIVLQATADGENTTIAASPLVRSQVTAVDFSGENGEAILNTYAGAEVNANSIISIYEPRQANATNNDEDSTEEEEEKSLEGIKDTASSLIGDSSESENESAPMDDDQIEKDRLQHLLAG